MSFELISSLVASITMCLVKIVSCGLIYFMSLILQERCRTLEEKYSGDQSVKDTSDSVIGRGISMEKSLSTALDSFDNLFCRRCLVLISGLIMRWNFSELILDCFNLDFFILNSYLTAASMAVRKLWLILWVETFIIYECSVCV